MQVCYCIHRLGVQLVASIGESVGLPWLTSMEVSLLSRYCFTLIEGNAIRLAKQIVLQDGRCCYVCAKGL